MNKPNEEPKQDTKKNQSIDSAQGGGQQKENVAKNDNQAAAKTQTNQNDSSRNSKNKSSRSKGSDKNKTANKRDEDDLGYLEKVIAINRITKVTKGGKNLSFSALVVVGDMKGNVGYSLAKAKEVSVAIRKAMAYAKKNMIRVPMSGTTITHEVIGQCSGSRVLLKPASEGTGVIASSPVRAVCDGAGIHNILTKCHRSNNPINVVKATIEGLSRLKSVEV